MASELIGMCYQDPPYHYSRAEEITIVFETDPELLQSILPPPLSILSRRGLAVFRVMRHERSPFGPYIGVYLGAPALRQNEPVFHLLTGLKTGFAGTVAAREIWGMPLQMGVVQMRWNESVLNVTVGRSVDNTFASVALALGARAEAPKENRLSLGTFASRRSPIDQEQGNVLVGLKGEVDWNGVEHWNAEAVLKLVGGEPGDDWSIFPVNRISSVRYNTGGKDTLNRGIILDSW